MSWAASRRCSAVSSSLRCSDSEVLARTASTSPRRTVCPSLGRHLLGHTGHPRHDVRHAVFVEADLAAELGGRLEFCGACGLELDAGLAELLVGEFDPALLVFFVGAVGRLFVGVFLAVAMRLSGLVCRPRVRLVARRQQHAAANREADQQDDGHRGRLFLGDCHGVSLVQRPAMRSTAAAAW